MSEEARAGTAAAEANGPGTTPAGRARRDEIERYVRDYSAEHGRGPTFREIASAVGLRSPSTAHTHVLALAAEGRLLYEPGGSRCVQPVRSPSRAAEALDRAEAALGAGDAQGALRSVREARSLLNV